MKIAQEIQISAGNNIRKTNEFGKVNQDIHTSILKVHWPHNSGSFAIHPGKHINGVNPIKTPCIDFLVEQGWTTESLPVPRPSFLHVGDFDALINVQGRYFAFEWETGNISSSHRSVNKILYALFNKTISGAFLVLPSRELAKHLTDRIGNFEELSTYFPFFREIVKHLNLDDDFVFDIFGVTYDVLSADV